MNLYEQLIVSPDSKIKLKKVDPAFHGDYKNEKEAEEVLAKHMAKISELQRKLYGEKSMLY